MLINIRLRAGHLGVTLGAGAAAFLVTLAGTGGNEVLAGMAAGATIYAAWAASDVYFNAAIDFNEAQSFGTFLHELAQCN